MWDVFVRQKAVKLTKNQTSGLEIINSSESLFHRDLALMIFMPFYFPFFLQNYRARLNPSVGVCLSFLVLVIRKTMISVMNACVMLQCLGSARHGPETVLSCVRTL